MSKSKSNNKAKAEAEKPVEEVVAVESAEVVEESAAIVESESSSDVLTAAQVAAQMKNSVKIK